MKNHKTYHLQNQRGNMSFAGIVQKNQVLCPFVTTSLLLKNIMGSRKGVKENSYTDTGRRHSDETGDVIESVDPLLRVISYHVFPIK